MFMSHAKALRRKEEVREHSASGVAEFAENESLYLSLSFTNYEFAFALRLRAFA
jgi:hypothetical protein